MTTSFDLLDTVLPPEGRYCVVGVGKYVKQTFWDTREEVDGEVQRLTSKHFNTFYGCAKYGEADNRKQENALFFRSVWMDVDCGPDKAAPDEKGVVKGYIDQEAGLHAVLKFCKTAKMPRPVIVDSGRGLHFYWILSATISRREWEPLSKRLRDLSLEHGLIVDPSVFEAARILRVPETFNYKEAEPLLVSVVSADYDATGYEEFRAILGAPEPEEDRSFLPKRSPLMDSLMENRAKRFQTIMIKSANGVGCNQLLHCYENQDTIDYNLWRSALSIATHCVDRDKAIHKMSSQHPDYSEGETELKAADIAGPHLCATFENQNPEGCNDCPNKGKIKSPILLGMEIAKAEEGDELVDEVAGTSTPVPVYPTPYFRGKNGGIYRDKGDESEPEFIFAHDIYVVKRMVDPVAGEIALIRFHRPKEGTKEFVVQFDSITNKEECKKLLSRAGVIGEDATFAKIRSLFICFLTISNYTEKAEIMRTQFGWVEGDTKIIIGDREITAQGSFYSPPSSNTKSIAEEMVPTGTLEKWKEVFNMYNKPGLEPNAFAALTGFGSLLLKFTGISGAIINVIHSKSGSGKSTALYMCNSIYGHPKNLGSIWKDTFNAKMHRLGVMNNLPNTLDEMTNTLPAEFSDLAYSISQGRGKNRLKSSSNEERVNLTSWQGITLASSNASFYEKLGAAKDSPDGESMRLLEYPIVPTTIIPVDIGKQMFDHQLMENYGHAGDIYAEWLVNNLEEALALLRSVQARIDKEVQFTSRERFWSAVAACNIAGGLIARQIGLIDYDMAAIYEWLKDMLNNMREDIKPPIENSISIIGEFINNHMVNALVVNGNVDARSSMIPLPILEPRGELLIRYEPDNERMFIAAGKFKDYCVSRQINYKATLKDLETKNVFLGMGNKRMSKGMKMVSPAVRAIEFNTRGYNLISIDSSGSQDGDRDSGVQD